MAARLGPKARNIVVVGTSGSGKSTLAEELSRRLALPYISSDNQTWLPNWVEKDHDLALKEFEQILSPDGWVLDGCYAWMRPKIFPLVHEIVWLDTGYLQCFWRVLHRSVRRAWSGELLWESQNKERIMSLFRRDGLPWWVLSTWHRRRRTYAELMAHDASSPRRWWRLQSESDRQRFYDAMERS